jgi:steroid 5-alpha reductase family enzyme
MFLFLQSQALGSIPLVDAQLKRFRADPANKGRVCDVGLWRWSRRPNDFFEWWCWLAYQLRTSKFFPLPP